MMEGGVQRDFPSHQPGLRRPPTSSRQYDEMQELNYLRQKVKSLQTERDSTVEQAQKMWKEIQMQKQQMKKMSSTTAKGQMSRVEQEALAKKVETLSAQNQSLQARYKDDLQGLKNALEEADQDRDNLRYKLSEYKREKDKLSEKLACLGPNESSQRQIESMIDQRDKLKKHIRELEKELRVTREKLGSAGKKEPPKPSGPTKTEFLDLKAELSREKQDNQSLLEERESLTYQKNEMRSKIEQLETKICGLEMECKRLRENSLVRGLGRMGLGAAEKGGSSEDLLNIRSRGSRGSLPAKKFSPSSADEDSDRSLQDLTSLTHSGDLCFSKKKLSASTSNLVSSDGYLDRHMPRMNESTPHLRFRQVHSNQALEDLQKENYKLVDKVAKLDQEKAEIEMQLKKLKQELQTAQLELNKTATQYKDAQNQIQMLSKEKGVAMRDNAASYQQSIQLETKVRELQTEQQITQKQRDIANKERDKIVMDSVSLKKKLEQIKSQRQKDAKEMLAMKHMKDRAVSEMTELRRQKQELQNKVSGLEEEMGKIRESMTHASMKLGPSGNAVGPVSKARSNQQSNPNLTNNSAISQDLQAMMDRLQVAESERKLLHKRLFGSDEDCVHPASMADVLHKVESLFQERDGLVLEIEALQASSTKLNEERIFDLKQRIEDLMMERDTLNAQNKQLKKEISSLSAQLISTEQERDKRSIEISRLGLQCQQMKSTQERLVEEHSKTLERVNELWKHKWPGAYDEQAWEEKHISFPLGSDGLAGFSVVGGRDQPQLPNPGAFIVTTVNSGGPADGFLKVGDVLESVNGQNLANADHREAVRAVKESKGALAVCVRRRRHANPLVVGIVSAVNSVPHVDPSLTSKPEEHNFSLLVTNKDNLGFRYDWESNFKVTEVRTGGPAHQILEIGDKIIQINGHSVCHEKPSAVKKLLKPQKNVLHLVIERNKKTNNDTGQAISPFHHEWGDQDLNQSGQRSSIALSSSSTPTYIRRSHIPETLTQVSPGSEMESKATGYSSSVTRERDLVNLPPRSRESYSSSRESNSQDMMDTQSQDSESKPIKLVSVVTQVKDPVSTSRPRPVSDGVMYGNYNERRIEYEEVLLSERTESQYSQSESYLSESCYSDYGLSSSQSIDLTFHSVSTVTHNRLTVDTMAPTQNEPSSGRRDFEEEEGEEYFHRLDTKRNAFRTRSSGEGTSTTTTSQSQEDCPSQFSDTQLSYPDMAGASSQEFSQSRTRRRSNKSYNKRKLFKPKHKSSSMHGSSSLTKLSSPEDRSSSLPPRSGMSSSGAGMRGRSFSNLSLSHAPSMSSVIEEPRRSTSTSNVPAMLEQDPLADATYIRANFTYIPRTPKELSIKAGDVFHIHDEAPSERFRACFWVSRLNSDGTDEQVGPIPNTMKAQEYLETQGESLDIPIYEEVEAYTGMRPVLIFGALGDQVVASLMEGYPNMFYCCKTELQVVEGTARITEARLKREVGEGKIIDFWRMDGGYSVIRLEALNERENKGKHCLMTGTIQAFQSLKSKAPPITILIKAMAEESIMTFSLEQMSMEEAKRIYEDAVTLEEQYRYEFSASLFLIYMDTLLGQIEDIVKREKRKQSWVSVTRNMQQ